MNDTKKRNIQGTIVAFILGLLLGGLGTITMVARELMQAYKMYWKLSDYLDVLTVLAGHRFIYFTSNKSSIVELCDWMGKHPALVNPFKDCQRREFNAHMNYSASYTDIMLYTQAA